MWSWIVLGLAVVGATAGLIFQNLRLRQIDAKYNDLWASLSDTVEADRLVAANNHNTLSDTVEANRLVAANGPPYQHGAPTFRAALLPGMKDVELSLMCDSGEKPIVQG